MFVYASYGGNNGTCRDPRCLKRRGNRKPFGSEGERSINASQRVIA